MEQNPVQNMPQNINQQMNPNMNSNMGYNMDKNNPQNMSKNMSEINSQKMGQNMQNIGQNLGYNMNSNMDNNMNNYMQQNQHANQNTNNNLFYNQNFQNNFNQNMNVNTNQINSFSEPPIKVKLVNLEDTSYLNSVLYLLGNIKAFKDYFLNSNNAKDITANIKNKPLSFVTHRLFLHFYNNKGEKEYKPDSYMEVLAALNIVYKSRKRRNPNELLSFILDNLHSELNITTGNYNINNNNNNNLYDKYSVIQKGVNNFANSNNSLISRLFNWFEIKELQCQQCSRSIYNFYTFNTFELDISGTYTFKKKYSNGNAITLNDCIQYHQNKRNEQKSLCNICRQYTKFLSHSKIFSSPNIFIFSMNRESSVNNLLNIPFIIEENIDLSFFVEQKESFKNYELIGIVSINSQNSQYISFCKSFVDNNWFYYSDEKGIIQIELNTILNMHNSTFTFVPLILLYNNNHNNNH
jgi:ubiquitin C-terminal hydrolase